MSQNPFKNSGIRARTYGSTMDAEIGFAEPSSFSGSFDQATFSRFCDTITTDIFSISKHGMYMICTANFVNNVCN
jgi:hypothetical protein